MVTTMTTHNQLEWTSADLMYAVEQVLLIHHHGNVRTLEQEGLNLGYPVLLTVMAAIELVASLCFDEEKKVKQVDKYFDQYMSKIDDRYGKRYQQMRVVSRSSSKPISLKISSRVYTNTGTILREAMRNRIAHSGGSVLVIDSRIENQEQHLLVKRNGDLSTLFIHTYTLFNDYLDSLSHVRTEVKQNSFFRHEFQRRLGQAWARIMLMCISVSDALTNESLIISSSEGWKEFPGNAFTQRLNCLGWDYIDRTLL